MTRWPASISAVAPAVLALACSLLSSLPVWAQAPPATVAETLSRYQRTVQYLRGSAAEEQAAFVAVALSELIAVYLAEADLARAEAAREAPRARGKLLGWSQAVDQYASHLLLVLEDVEQGFPVTLRPDPLGPVTVTVADRTVILGHPRADQQAAFELRVLTDFCSRHECERMTASADEPEPIAASQLRVNPLWTFTNSGPVCSSDGINLYFNSSRNLPIFRGLCEALLQELVALATSLAWQMRHGVTIDWQGLAIAATPGRTEHLVRLNASGDSILAALPLLYGSAELLADVTPWLYARSTGAVPPVIGLTAADYGWESAAQ